jgi:heme exporter protein C
MHRFANPTRALKIADRVLPWSTAAAGILIVLGLFYGLYDSPMDYLQKNSVRIMYVHVPSAWMALFIYTFIAAASAVGLIWRHPLADIAAKAAAPIGAGFTFVCLVSGSLWGRPTWGTYWVWDARLTSVLVLFFLYLGYMALWEAFDDPNRAARAAAILALVGFVNIPIIKFSVDWWNTLHQGASLSFTHDKIAFSMLRPLLLMAGGFTAYFVSVLIYRVRAEILARRLQVLQLARTRG